MKAYYKCPLQAAYMNKNFGVKCVYDDEVMDWWEYLEYISQLENRRTLEKLKLPIHPDSMSVFEPKIHDIIDRADADAGWGKPYTICGDAGLNDKLRESQTNNALYSDLLVKKIMACDKHHGIKIIQRNDKPFFWPEFEGEE